jgi:hypothetical protein
VSAAIAAALVVSLLSLAAAGMLARRVVALERALQRRPMRADPVAGDALRHVGLVRFRAYHDVGGDHSFALALLDTDGSGVVMNCLYHRERCRVYAKPVAGWASGYALTDEEREAIRRARDGDRTVDMHEVAR